VLRKLAYAERGRSLWKGRALDYVLPIQGLPPRFSLLGFYPGAIANSAVWQSQIALEASNPKGGNIKKGHQSGPSPIIWPGIGMFLLQWVVLPTLLQCALRIS
jgi:hypothetical protein